MCKQPQKDYLDFLKDLFKDRTYVKLAYMTGILPIKKYGTHSALNIFDEISMTAPKKLAQYASFTEKEVQRLCKEFHMNFDGLKDSVIAMLGGERCSINPRKFQNDMTSFASKDDVFTLLVHLGYLAYDEETQEVFIPNLEVAEEFKNAVEGSEGWEQLANVLINSEDLLTATFNQDAETVAKSLDMIHMEHTSILSYNNENSLSCVITLA